MLGLSEGEIKQKLEYSFLGLASISQNRELRSLASRLAEGVAKVMVENNGRIELQVRDEIKNQLRNVIK